MDIEAIKKLIISKITVVNDCWIYPKRNYKTRTHCPYPGITIEKKWWQIHRISWALYNGGIGNLLSDHVICHKCNTPACCNPEHLYQGTLKDNWEDSRSTRVGKKKIRYGYDGQLISD